jgi:signal transduction histidine kinase
MGRQTLTSALLVPMRLEQNRGTTGVWSSGDGCGVLTKPVALKALDALPILVLFVDRQGLIRSSHGSGAMLRKNEVKALIGRHLADLSQLPLSQSDLDQVWQGTASLWQVAWQGGIYEVTCQTLGSTLPLPLVMICLARASQIQSALVTTNMSQVLLSPEPAGTLSPPNARPYPEHPHLSCLQQQALATHLRQGYAFIEADLTVQGHHGGLLSKLLKGIDAKHHFHVITDFFVHTTLPAERLRRLEFDLRTIFGCHDLQWLCTAASFPTMVSFRDQLKPLELKFQPVFDDAGVVVQVLLLVDQCIDAPTAVDQSHHDEWKQVADLLAVDEEVYHLFMGEAASILRQCGVLMSRLPDAAPAAYHGWIGQTFRLIHTLKGSAGLFNFTAIQNALHELEDHLVRISNQSSPLTTGETDDLTISLARIGDHLNSYEQLRVKLLGKQAKEKAQKLSHSHLSWLLIIVNRVYQFLSSPAQDPRDIDILQRDLQQALSGVEKIPLSHYLHSFDALTVRLAIKYNKKIAPLQVYSSVRYFPKDLMVRLAEMIVHGITNSLTHGIEATEQRLAVGKPVEGQVAIRITEQEGILRLVIEDDGQGIDPDQIAASAVAKGLISSLQADQMDEQGKLNLIFASGLSAKDEADIYRGRGVGMGAVKELIESLGGKVHLETEALRGTRVILTLPFSSQVPLLERSFFRFGSVIGWAFPQFEIPTRLANQFIFGRRKEIMQCLQGLAKLLDSEKISVTSVLPLDAGGTNSIARDSVMLPGHPSAEAYGGAGGRAPDILLTEAVRSVGFSLVIGSESRLFFASDAWFARAEYINTQAQLFDGVVTYLNSMLTIKFNSHLHPGIEHWPISIYWTHPSSQKSARLFADYFTDHLGFSTVSLELWQEVEAPAANSLVVLISNEHGMGRFNATILPRGAQVVLIMSTPEECDLEAVGLQHLETLPIFVRGPLNKAAAFQVAELIVVRYLSAQLGCPAIPQTISQQMLAS